MCFRLVLILLNQSASIPDIAAANEISMGAAVVADLLELDGVSTLKEEQRATPKAFLSGKDALASLLIGFGKKFC